VISRQINIKMVGRCLITDTQRASRHAQRRLVAHRRLVTSRSACRIDHVGVHQCQDYCTVARAVRWNTFVLKKTTLQCVGIVAHAVDTSWLRVHIRGNRAAVADVSRAVDMGTWQKIARHHSTSRFRHVRARNADIGIG
jgi:hypothetical protein